MKKKLLLGVCLILTAFSMAVAGCGNAENKAEGQTTSTVDEDTSVSSLEDSAENEGENSSLSSIELTRMMGNGINLGNTMEAYGRAEFGTNGDPTQYETYWGQPVTTKESIQGMKEAGFDTIRIPVAWTNAMPYETGDYTINQAYIDRVKEITEYALDAGMYVIINDHWDGGWWGMFGSASQETRDKAMDIYTSMWTQISEEFNEYSDYVIFESGNEEIGFRLNDTDIATDSGTLSDAECFETANRINQAFVDTVRATGGINANRFLLIAGFGTEINNTVIDKFKMPVDTADDKLLISVHFYDPSGYCIFESLSSWGREDDYDDMNTALAKMQKFTDAGVGVVIGEYGVLIENSNELKEGTEAYLTNFLDNCNLYGYCPVLWDCNNQYNRNECVMNYKTVARLYQKYSLENELLENESYDEVVAKAENGLVKNKENAITGFVLSEDTAMAWIMYNSSDWGVQYSVGDVYDPTTMTGGIVAGDVEITGEGTYTVSLDLTGTYNGYGDSTVFSAIGIANGEKLYPDYRIEIKEVLINGEPYELTGVPYTSSDDGICTRVNLYNEWVSKVPDDIRCSDAANASPTVLDPGNLGHIETIEITFDYVAP